MNIETFIANLKEKSPNQNLHPLLKGLWFDNNGDWESAHNIAQSNEGELDYDRFHAYLHRKEGDNWNANYWYKRCGESMPKITLDAEWHELLKDFIPKY